MGDHLAISGGPFTGPFEPSQNMFRGGRQVFQVGQAPSGPTVIRPLTLIPRYTIPLLPRACSQMTRIMSYLQQCAKKWTSGYKLLTRHIACGPVVQSPC